MMYTRDESVLGTLNVRRDTCVIHAIAKTKVHRSRVGEVARTTAI